MFAIQRLKRSVIHIVAGGGIPAAIREEEKARAALIQKTQRREQLTAEETKKLAEPFSGMVEGTAVVLEDEGNLYLATAAHVLRYGSAPNFLPRTYIGRVRSLEEPPIPYTVKDDRGNVESSYNPSGDFLSHLHAGPTGQISFHPDPNIDLALVSLASVREKEFAAKLKVLGAEPLAFENLLDGPSDDGAEVCTIGFPGMARLDLQHLPPAITAWLPDTLSLPFATFGHIGLRSEKLPFFLCDLAVVPGNSGGPIFEGEKLAGIVSGQPSIPLATSPPLPDGWRIQLGSQAVQLLARAPYAQAFKASLLRVVLDEQRNKDSKRK